ncbi:MAG TPA: sigma-54 dependent transcriptional regulator [Syntrophales bacterium]
METILIIDEDPVFLENAKNLLRLGGYDDVQTEADPGRAMERIDRGVPYDAVLIDLDMQGLDGLWLMDAIHEADPDTECIVLSALNEARLAVDCIKKGACDYLTKPVPDDRFLAAVKQAVGRLRRSRDLFPQPGAPDSSAGANAFESIVTCSDRMRRILHEARLHALSDVTVLITGESGTGKELLARAIHRASGRAVAPFLSINMASLAGSLFDAEFFGHTRGAFTGAERDRVGYLEHSNGGTVFLDEVADLPFDFQGKLLRVLEHGEFIRLGASAAQKADVRFISATNADLDRQLARRSFRQDLYYRLKGVQLHLPPLRERREDIPLLVDHFLSEFGRSRAVHRIDGEAMRALAGYDYPGNVRELRSVIQSAVNLVEGSCLTLNSLPAYLRQYHRKRSSGTFIASGSIAPLEEIERRQVLCAYEQSGQNKVRAARVLGIGINTLRRKLLLYGIR